MNVTIDEIIENINDHAATLVEDVDRVVTDAYENGAADARSDATSDAEALHADEQRKRITLAWQRTHPSEPSHGWFYEKSEPWATLAEGMPVTA